LKRKLYFSLKLTYANKSNPNVYRTQTPALLSCIPLLAAILFSIIYAIVQVVQKKSFTEKSRKISLIGFIAAHLQLLIGIVLYVISPVGLSNFSGEAMQETLSRIYILEHPLTMIIGIVLFQSDTLKPKNPAMTLPAINP